MKIHFGTYISGDHNCLRTDRKNSHGACNIDRCQWSCQAEECDAWCLTINHAVSFFKNICTANQDKKDIGWRITKLRHQTLIIAAAVISVCPALALSATGMPTVNIDHPLLNFHSQSQAMRIVKVNPYRINLI